MTKVTSYFKTKPIRLKGRKKQVLNYKVIKRDNLMCQNPYCKEGTPLDLPHHIIFKSAGGSDVEENLTLVCVHCHTLIHREWLNVSGVYPDLTWTVKK